MKMTLTKKAQEIVKLHRELLSSLKMTIEKAIRIGELLIQAKAEMKHGQWLPWLKNNVPFTTVTAQSYMRCFDHKAELKSKSILHLTDAYSFIERMNYWQKQLPAPVKKGRPKRLYGAEA